MKRLGSWAGPGLPWIVGPGMLGALYLIFMVVPTERVQGIVQRIFYFHVPAAWAAFLGFVVVSVASALFLWSGRAAYDRVARAAAELGMIFCTLVLLTGPIWARPIWGAWWTWDPRLTMTVILWTIYAAYLLLRSFGGADEAVARYAAVLGIVGALDIPLIMISVRLWRGMHPSVIGARPGEGGLADPSMRFTLFYTGLCFVLLFVWMLLVRLRVLRVEDEIEAIHRRIHPA
ncbi:MAG: cytochrome c biogenesis protein CcsA [Deltaproteobacteria bacterium]|nr:cytochrome c biogenesis protein CcsA [Deltaproteobacteria bacterium]